MWHDKEGFKVCRSMKTCAEIALVLFAFMLIVGLFFLFAALNGQASFKICILCFILATMLYFGSVILLWCASLGENLAIIRQQLENRNIAK